MDPKHIVQLSGRSYPLYAGILAEAHERGLLAIETTLLQIPSEENGHTAIVKAIVRMKDGSAFEAIGDANPKNVNPRIATALIRMAETRAKGRALRDACNIGETMLEELPDLEDAPTQSSPSRYGAKADQAVLDAAARGRERMHAASTPTGFEATYADDTRSYTREELIHGTRTLIAQATALGVAEPATIALDLERTPNGALLTVARTLRPKVKAAQEAPA